LHNVDLVLMNEQRKLLTRMVIGGKLNEEEKETVWAFLDVLGDEIFEKTGIDNAD
jgi:hypothetical protein